MGRARLRQPEDLPADHAIDDVSTADQKDRNAGPHDEHRHDSILPAVLSLSLDWYNAEAESRVPDMYRHERRRICQVADILPRWATGP